MFREMRRRMQQLDREEAIRILTEGSHGTLALSGDDGYPYALPISYAYFDDCLIFHSAITGHKIDSIRRSGKASFTVVERDDVVPEGYTTLYRSVIAFGRIRIIDDDAEKIRLLRLPSEVFNKAGKPVRIILGDIIPPEVQAGINDDETFRKYLRDSVYGLSCRSL